MRQGYRPYICGDAGYGVVIAWSRSVYVSVEEYGSEPERYAGQWVPTEVLVPDWEATFKRVSTALDCENVRPMPIDPSLERLLSSSVKVEEDDYYRLIAPPLLPLLRLQANKS